MSFAESVEIRPSLEEQFENMEELEVAGGTAEVVDLRPEEMKSEVPVMLAPGWGCTLKVYKNDLMKIANRKRRVLSLNHPRRGRNAEELPEETSEEFPRAELEKALNLLKVLEAKGVERTDVIAHSEGAINTTIAAILHPEKFRNIVFYGPAGLIGPDTFTRMLKGFAAQGQEAKSRTGIEGLKDFPVTEEEKQTGKIAALEALKYLAGNPLRGLREAKAISESQIHDMVRYLHEKGIGIYIMTGVDDPVFPTAKMQGIVKGDMVDGFLTVRSGHGMLFTEAAESLLSAKDERRLEEGEVEVGTVYEVA